jgi:signal transduction histidine kinase
MARIVEDDATREAGTVTTRAPGSPGPDAETGVPGTAIAPIHALRATRRAEEKNWRERIAELAETSDGSTTEDELGLFDAIDRVATFAPAILALRWGTTVASVALATQDLNQNRSLILAWCVVIVSYTVLRTIRPIRYVGDVRSLLSVLGEVVLYVAALCSTGFWESPFILSVLTAICVAGFARGFGFALRVGIAASLAVSLPYAADSSLTEEAAREHVILSGQWSLVLLLVALIAGYARRISGEADRQHSLALDRLGRLADANALLFSLHRVTQTLPASLDLDDVLDTTVGRLRGLFEFDTAVILAFDDTDGGWQVLRREGGSRLPSKLPDSQLPAPLRRAITEGGVVKVPNLPDENAAGLNAKSTSALYAVLPARGAIVGVIALEHASARHFKARDAELLRGFVEPVALALDNARWFARLRTVGADEERTRIARDLHDRIGQSLAYLAFELDRIVTHQQQEGRVDGSLEHLRDDVRGVIGEVRDTLYDLRTDVSDTQDLAATLEAFVARIRDRSTLHVDLYCDRNDRLPLLQEREMWRIAQEALTNVERHAQARRVRVLWRCNGESAALEVTDDGQGFPIGRAGRLDSYGILGMRERASSIGATLEVTSQLGKGTRVRCSLIRSVENPD